MSDLLWRALRDVQVAQLGQNVVDLGLVVDASLESDGSAVVKLILPSRHWPWVDELLQAARATLLAQPAVRSVHVSIVSEPVWTPYRMVDRLKVDLGLPLAEPQPVSGLGRSTIARLRRALGRWLSD